MSALMSMTSPQKYRPFTRRDSMVRGSISRVDTPPAVTMASAMGRWPTMVRRKSLSKLKSRLRSVAVI